MSLLRSKIIGLIMLLFALIVGSGYTLCIFINGEGVFFRDSTFYGIPILNSYWTLALPLLIGVLIFIFLIGWLGVAAIFSKEPQVSEEEINRIRELDKKLRNKSVNK